MYYMYIITTFTVFHSPHLPHFSSLITPSLNALLLHSLYFTHPIYPISHHSSPLHSTLYYYIHCISLTPFTPFLITYHPFTQRFITTFTVFHSPHLPHFSSLITPSLNALLLHSLYFTHPIYPISHHSSPLHSTLYCYIHCISLTPFTPFLITHHPFTQRFIATFTVFHSPHLPNFSSLITPSLNALLLHSLYFTHPIYPISHHSSPLHSTLYCYIHCISLTPFTPFLITHHPFTQRFITTFTVFHSPHLPHFSSLITPSLNALLLHSLYFTHPIYPISHHSSPIHSTLYCYIHCISLTPFTPFLITHHPFTQRFIATFTVFHSPHLPHFSSLITHSLNALLLHSLYFTHPIYPISHHSSPLHSTLYCYIHCISLTPFTPFLITHHPFTQRFIATFTVFHSPHLPHFSSLITPSLNALLLHSLYFTHPIYPISHHSSPLHSTLYYYIHCISLTPIYPISHHSSPLHSTLYYYIHCISLTQFTPFLITHHPFTQRFIATFTVFHSPHLPHFSSLITPSLNALLLHSLYFTHPIYPISHHSSPLHSTLYYYIHCISLTPFTPFLITHHPFTQRFIATFTVFHSPHLPHFSSLITPSLNALLLHSLYFTHPIYPISHHSSPLHSTLYCYIHCISLTPFTPFLITHHPFTQRFIATFTVFHSPHLPHFSSLITHSLNALLLHSLYFTHPIYPISHHSSPLHSTLYCYIHCISLTPFTPFLITHHPFTQRFIATFTVFHSPHLPHFSSLITPSLNALLLHSLYFTHPIYPISHHSSPLHSTLYCYIHCISLTPFTPFLITHHPFTQLIPLLDVIVPFNAPPALALSRKYINSVAVLHAVIYFFRITF